jgi:carboxyl-terminal processing protease
MKFLSFHTFFTVLFGVLLGIFFASFIFSYDGWGWSAQDKEEDIFSSKKVEEVKELIKANYYQFSEKSKKDIEDGLLTGLVESLWDKHSSYFNPKEAKEFEEMLTWDFEGIWAVIDEHLRGIFIRKVLGNSPAKKAWLEDGDIITKVAWESMIWVSVEDAVKKIRWPKWSEVTLTYVRDEDENIVTIMRDKVVIPSVDGKMLSGSTVGYVEVAFFWEQTKSEFEKTITDLYRSGAKSFILDFRDNGWGFLDTAVELLSYLLPDWSLAVTTRENDKTKTRSFFTTSNPLTNTEIPIVMIINNLSASATEIVAWALQDYHRAIIIGEKSYGKWSVQDAFALDDWSLLKITIWWWYTPKDKNINKDGITPDVSIPLFDRDYRDKYDRQLEWAKIIMKEITTPNKTLTGVIEEMQSYNFTK